MALTIPKGSQSDVWHDDPLTWRGLAYKDGHRGATLSCDKGHSGTLTDHKIAEDGTVTPSVMCPEKCGWHEMVILEDWDPEAVKS